MDARFLERRYRLIRLARSRSDWLALAILEADRRYKPQYEPDLYRWWMGLRWTRGSREAAWHA